MVKEAIDLFEVRQMKFRVWDGKKMWCPKKTSRYNLDQNGISILIHKCYDQSYALARPEHVVMFWTGKQDAAGVDEYEGDIVEWKGQQGIIEWCPELSRYFIRVEVDGDTHRFYCGSSETVIGNVFENPELVEVCNGRKQD